VLVPAGVLMRPLCDGEIVLLPRLDDMGTSATVACMVPVGNAEGARRAKQIDTQH